MNQECCPSFLDLIFLSLVLINMKVNKTFSKKKKFNTGSCVKGDWLSIDLSKFCDMICEKKKKQRVFPSLPARRTVRFLSPPNMLHLRCYQSHKLWIKTKDLIWFSTICFGRKKKREKKNEPLRGLLRI